MFKLLVTIKTIGALTKVSKTFQKREFTAGFNSGENDEYPQTCKFEACQKAVKILDDVKVGDEVTVHFNLRGREWDDEDTGETVVFNTLDAWKFS